MQRILKKFLIMDENDALSEYNKIPLGHNRTNGAVYSKIYFNPNTFDYNHYVYSDYLVCSVTASAHIIRY